MPLTITSVRPVGAERWVRLVLVALIVVLAATALWLISLLVPWQTEQELPPLSPNTGVAIESAAHQPHPPVAARSAALALGDDFQIPNYPEVVTVGYVEKGTLPTVTVDAQVPRKARPLPPLPAQPQFVPNGPQMRCGVDCEQGQCDACGQGEAKWKDQSSIFWNQYGQGEYVGPFRTQHTPEYRLRVDDQLECVFRLTRVETSTPYELNVGDEVRVEALSDKQLDRDLIIQPDGTITLRLLGQVHAARKTVTQLRDALEEAYKKYYKVPAISVTPLKMNTRLEDLRASVDARAGSGGQSRQARVTPEGTIALPAIGSVPAQGLTLAELKRELDERYAREVEGIEVTPVLVARAPRYVYVLGEVKLPGRYEMNGPTTAMQAIALAGGWNYGGNLRQIVVFRRGDDWRLMATKLDLQGALWGKKPCPADEIWLRDADLIIVPKSEIQRANDWIDLVFTKGIYGIIPFQGATVNFAKLSSL